MAHLNALVVDDSPDDALLLVRELRRGGYDVEPEVVASRREVATPSRAPGTSSSSTIDLPGFSGLEAIELVRRADPTCR